MAIIIKEQDNTATGTASYSNFTVVIPGVVRPRTNKGTTENPSWYYGGMEVSSDQNGESVFDENGIYECSDPDEFVQVIGKVAPISDPTSTESIASKQYGNQMAYELLKLGYTVLYKKLTWSSTETSTWPSELQDSNFWSILKDKALYDFRYISTGGYDNVAACNCISAIADGDTTTDKTSLKGRGDCIALVDAKRSTYENGYTDPESKETTTGMEGVIKGLMAAAANLTSANQYSAIFAPYVTYSLSDETLPSSESEEAEWETKYSSYYGNFGNNKVFSPSFHYLACAAKAFNTYNEWYAVANVDRGISDYTIASAAVKLGDAAITALLPRYFVDGSTTTKSINLVVKMKNQGYLMWGNRTAYKTLTSGLKASHFLNIRQLCCTLKKAVYTVSRKLTFDPNSDVLYINYCNGIRPTLEAMKADQGVEDYKFVKVKTDKKALLSSRIRIVPVEAVEDFDVLLSLEDSISGVSVGEED